MYTATEVGIRSVAGNFNVIKVPKFFLAFQVARIKSAQGTLGTAPGVQVEHLLGKGMSLFSFFYSLTTASWRMTMMLRECSVVMKWSSEREREYFRESSGKYITSRVFDEKHADKLCLI